MSLAAAMTAAARMDLRILDATQGDGRGDVQCRVCGWRTDGRSVSLGVFAAAPFPCLRCTKGDFRPIGEIAAEIARRVRENRHG